MLAVLKKNSELTAIGMRGKRQVFLFFNQTI